MIIKIAVVPNMPILDNIPTVIKNEFCGLVVQSRSYNKLPSKLRLDYGIYSRTLCPGKPYHVVTTSNILGAAEEANKNKLYNKLLVELLDKADGLVFSCLDVVTQCF